MTQMSFIVALNGGGLFEMVWRPDGSVAQMTLGDGATATHRDLTLSELTDIENVISVARMSLVPGP